MHSVGVSILVLMELLRECKAGFVTYAAEVCFNPCSNGITTRVFRSCPPRVLPVQCFNPCSNGITTRVVQGFIADGYVKSFNPCSNGITTRVGNRELSILLLSLVSILVLMELLRELFFFSAIKRSGICFNPCSNGITTRVCTGGGFPSVFRRFQSLF